MSVVNRMLQDIDRRSGAAETDARGPFPDVRGVPLPAPRGPRNAWLAGGIVLLAVSGAMIAANWDQLRSRGKEPGAAMPQPVARQAPAATAPPVQPPAAAVALEPAASAAKVEERSIPETTPSPPVALRPTIDYFKLSFNLSPVTAAAPAREVARTATAASAKASGEVARTPTTAIVKPSGEVARTPAPGNARASVEVTRTPATAKPLVAMRQVAAAETVTSARILWEEGSRAGALATLKEALVAAEDSRDPEATKVLARELAGMELASNRAPAALELLLRLAGLFGEDADAYALRGNAQQRLSMHPEAAESYLAALRMRPTEGKWMLGAAISLAASGRTAEAQSWVDRARDRGAITPPIAAYLQQLGVVARR